MVHFANIDFAFSAGYTRISSYCGWIEKITRNEVNCVNIPEITPLGKSEKNEMNNDEKANDAMTLNFLNLFLVFGVLKLL